MIRKLLILGISFLVSAILAGSAYANSLLQWNSPGGDVDGYRIYYGLSEGNYTFSVDVGDVTQYLLGNLSLEEGSTYYFVVRAYNDAGESGDSNVRSYTVPASDDTTPPSAPENVQALWSNGSIEVSWSASPETDVRDYHVYYGTSSRDYTLPLTTTETSLVLTGLETTSTYYIAVAAVDNSENESGVSTPETVVAGYAETSQLSIAVNDGMDDVEEHLTTGRIDASSSDLELADDPYSGNQMVGLRFNSVSIPQGAAILNAYIEFETDEIQSGAASLQIYVQTADNAPAFTTNAYDVSQRSKNTTPVAWSDISAWSAVNGKHQTPDLKTILQQIVNRDGWAPGNSVVFMITGTGVRTAESYNGEMAAAPTLYVEYGPAVEEDTTAPVVSLSAPTANSTFATQTGSINIGGTATDNESVTQVSWTNSRGGEGVAVGTDSWSASGIALGEGENVITVTAQDGAGNVSSDSLTVVYTIPDTTAPVVSIQDPAGETYETQSGSINITGTATDNEAVTQVSWTNSRGGEGIADGTGAWTINGIALGEGENVITVTAVDEVGNFSSDVLTVVYTIPDTTAPEVSIESPTGEDAYEISNNIIDLSGTASDDTAVTTVTWINSRGGNGTADGTGNWAIPGIALAEGENVITVTAVDAAGNFSSDVLTVVYTIPDTEAPSLSLSAPTTGTFYFTRAESLTISGSASDNIGIKEIQWSVEDGASGVADGTTSWSVDGIVLTRYWNYITITAVDFAGNEKVYNLRVFCWK